MNATDSFDAGSIIIKARALLSSNDGKLSSESLEEIDRAINLLYAKFNELDDHEALATCGIIGFAITKGSKNASKKKPKLNRWSSNPPPHITSLPNDAERSGAIGILKNIKAPWVASYALTNAAKFDGHKQITSTLIKWIDTGSTCSADILHGFTEFLKDVPETPKAQTEAILKQFPTLFESPINCDPEKHSSAFLNAITVALNVFNSRPECFDKSNPIETLISSCDKSSGLEPHILFNPEVQNALCIASKAILKPSKSTSKAIYNIGLRLLSLAEWHVRLHGIDNSADILESLQSISNDLLLTSTAKKSKKYTSLLVKSADTPNPQKITTTDIHTLASSLLLAWDDLLQSSDIESSTVAVTAIIQSMASTLGLARFGKTGQVISFDPFRHFIDGDPTTNVIVAIPGITVVRPDGSERVLVKAVVNPT